MSIAHSSGVIQDLKDFWRAAVNDRSAMTDSERLASSTAIMTGTIGFWGGVLPILHMKTPDDPMTIITMTGAVLGTALASIGGVAKYVQAGRNAREREMRENATTIFECETSWQLTRPFSHYDPKGPEYIALDE